MKLPRFEIPIEQEFSNLHRYSTLYSWRHMIEMSKRKMVVSISADKDYNKGNHPKNSVIKGYVWIFQNS